MSKTNWGTFCEKIRKKIKGPVLKALRHAIKLVGADPDLQTSAIGTALHLAAEQNKPDVVRVLVGRRANQTIKRNNGETARENAIRLGNTECAALLQ